MSDSREYHLRESAVVRERESPETQKKLADRVFNWLQQTHDTLVPELNRRASELANTFSLSREDFTQVRSLIDELDDAQVLPVRLQLAGFDEWIVDQLDDGSFDEAREAFSQRLAELFPTEASQIEASDLLIIPEENTVEQAVALEVEQSKDKQQSRKKLGAEIVEIVSKRPQPRAVARTADDLFGRIAPNDEELSWQEKAVCAQVDPEAFFPEKGGSTREAKKVCQGCEVRTECLTTALSNDERFGIWGGLSERERRKLKKKAV